MTRQVVRCLRSIERFNHRISAGRCGQLVVGQQLAVGPLSIASDDLNAGRSGDVVIIHVGDTKDANEGGSIIEQLNLEVALLISEQPAKEAAVQELDALGPFRDMYSIGVDTCASEGFDHLLDIKPG